MSDDNMDYGQMSEEERQEDLRGSLENGLADLGEALNEVSFRLSEVYLRAGALDLEHYQRGINALRRGIEDATDGHPIVAEAMMLAEKQAG